MKHQTKLGAALLALCLLLSACGGKSENPADAAGSGVYTSDILPLDLPLTELTEAGAGGGNFYLAGMEEEEIEEVGEENGEFSSGFTFSSTISDEEGYTFYSGMGKAALYRLDTGLATLFTCKCPETVERLTALADGGTGAVSGGSEGRTVYPIDPENKTLGAACALTGSARDIYAGDADNAFFFRSGDSLYGWDAGAPRKVLSWSGAGVDSGQVAAVTFLEDGQGAVLLRDGSGWPVTYALARLAPADEDTLAGPTVLTLATMGMSSETRTRVLEFNRTNSKYRIEVRDYSEYNTAEDVSAGLTKLNTEILAGNMPDLLDVSGGLPLRQYAFRGMLEDLWPYIESDPNLGRGAATDRVGTVGEVLRRDDGVGEENGVGYIKKYTESPRILLYPGVMVCCQRMPLLRSRRPCRNRRISTCSGNTA